MSAHLIHLAIILILLGYVGSNFLVTEDNITLPVGGNGEEVGEYTVYATKFDIVEGIKFVEIDTDLRNYAYQTQYVDVKVMKTDSIIGNERLITIMSTSLLNGQNKLVRSEIKVLGTPLEDVYLTYQQAYEDDTGEISNVSINVKILPLMKLLWAGMWLMVFGMIFRITSENKLLH